MSGGDQKNSVSISQLAKEIKTLNSPVQQRSKALFAQISGLNSSIEKKIQECDQFCDSDQLKQLDGIFERSIELLKDFKQRQQTLIKQLKTDNTQGNKKDMWKNIGAKVDQVQLEVNNLVASMPLLDKIVTIELQIKKLEDICDEL